MARKELNAVDRARVARVQANKLRVQATAEAIDLAPSLVGVLGGLGDEIRALRLTTERSIAALTALTFELEALRMQRTRGSNGSAENHTLTAEKPNADPDQT